MRSSLVGTLSAVALALIACSGAGGSIPASGVVQSSISRDTSPQVASSDLQSLVSGNTTFAFDLYPPIAAGNGADNLFYSPYSVSIALAMTYAGAGSSTATPRRELAMRRIGDWVAAALGFSLGYQGGSR